jgi:hypothetical protein
MSSFPTITSKPVTEGTMKRAASSRDLKAFCERMKSIHEKRSPEAMQAAIERAGRASKIMKGMHRGLEIMESNTYSTASAVMALDSFNKVTIMRSESIKSPEAMSFSSIQAKNESRQMRARKNLSRAAEEKECPGGSEAIASKSIDLNEIEAEFRGAFSVGIESEASPVTIEAVLNEMDRLLIQLKVEPENDEELAAKFGLYETLLKTVETIREQTLGFWEENKELFIGGSRESALKKLRSIDDENALSIPDDDGHTWFVFFMTKQAGKNSKTIEQVLSNLRGRLELLALEEIDCPFCLEVIVIGNDTTLGCCHKTCNDCWQHWTALKGTRAFCPLCRHNDFISSIADVTS